MIPQLFPEIGVKGAAVAIEQHDQCKAERGFGSSDHEQKERENLTV